MGQRECDEDTRLQEGFIKDVETRRRSNVLLVQQANGSTVAEGFGEKNAMVPAGIYG